MYVLSYSSAASDSTNVENRFILVIRPVESLVTRIKEYGVELQRGVMLINEYILEKSRIIRYVKQCQLPVFTNSVTAFSVRTSVVAALSGLMLWVFTDLIMLINSPSNFRISLFLCTLVLTKLLVFNETLCYISLYSDKFYVPY